jgi:hypothetical protein
LTTEDKGISPGSRFESIASRIMRALRHSSRLHSDEPPGDPTAVLQRLRGGWRPSRDNLIDALVLEDWRLVPGVPYLLQGWDGSTLKFGMALAFDAAHGWARRIDRWVVLGAPLGVPPCVSNDEVMRAAALALAAAPELAPQIAIEARMLAERARGAGLDAAAYLLESAAWEADISVALRETLSPG